jgi:hypothetical protein
MTVRKHPPQEDWTPDQHLAYIRSGGTEKPVDPEWQRRYDDETERPFLEQEDFDDDADGDPATRSPEGWRRHFEQQR